VGRYSFGDDTLDLVEYGWYVDNANGQPSAVAQLRPNAWGLFDMHGNVWELVQDYYGESSSGEATDPIGPERGTSVVMRGGCFGSDPDKCTAGNRGYLRPSTRNEKTGFRVVAEPR
jgi:formylglycine-generating enzyme required for sulfatase activity